VNVVRQDIFVNAVLKDMFVNAIRKDMFVNATRRKILPYLKYDLSLYTRISTYIISLNLQYY
jgi:hypothetical protein